MFVRAAEAFVGRIVILLALVLIVFVGVFIGTQEAAAWSSETGLTEYATTQAVNLAGWIGNQIAAVRSALGI